VVLRWVAAFVVMALAGAGAVALVVALGFGPGSFVTAYLAALGRRDAASALALPGVDPGAGDRALLTSAALPGLADIRITGDQEHDGGRHRITASWTSHGAPGESTFEVERVGTRFGVFPIWGFAQSPLADLSLDVRNARDVTVGQQQVHTRGVGAHDYPVLVPGEYRFVRQTTYVTSAVQPVLVDTVGQRMAASVDVEATPRFVAAVSRQVDRLLARCTTQKVLFPVGCPFGQEIENRVTSTPVWSIVEGPAIRLEGAGDDVSWVIPSAPATAHLKVGVQSLFDGRASTFDKDVPFTIRATVRFDAKGAITLSDVR
jgi:hypothetical protein